MGAMQAAVAQKHPQERLVTLQPVSPAPLTIKRTPSLENQFHLVSCIAKKKKKEKNTL